MNAMGFVTSIMARLSFPRIAVRASVFAFVACASLGCTPQDVLIPIPTATPSSSPTPGTVAGFSGATKAQTINGSKVQVYWSLASDPTIVAYNIYDVTNLFGTPKLIATVSSPATYYTINSLNSQTLYYFRVRAANAQGVEDGNVVNVAAIPYGGAISPANVINSSSATINFNTASNADQVNIYCATVNNPAVTDFSLYTSVSMASASPPTSATLTGLSGGTVYTCRAAVQMGQVVDNNVNYVSFTPIGQASTMVFQTQPGGAAAHSPFSAQPVIVIQDANGNTVTAGPDANVAITLSVATNSPSTGSLNNTGIVIVQAVKGVATFSGLFLDEAGTMMLTATKPSTVGQSFGSAAMSVNSNNFIISPGTVTATNSSITVSPSGPLVADGATAYTVTITLKDQYGNPVAGIKPTFASNISGDGVTQPTTVTNVNGVTTGSLTATVADLMISATPNPRSINISSPSGLTTDTAIANFIAGRANKLAFTTQPANSPAGPGMMSSVQVAVEDIQGNIVSNDSVTSVSLTISSSNNPGNSSLTGTTTVGDVNGTSTFNVLGIGGIGNGYKLLATSVPALTQALSSSFNILSAGPTKIVLNGGPTVVQAGLCSGSNFNVQLEDANGNLAAPVSGTSTTVTIAASGSATVYSDVQCTAPVTSLAYNSSTNTKKVYIKDLVAETVTLTATDASLTTGTLSVPIKPSQMGLVGTANALSGSCSPFVVTTYGAQATPVAGPIPTATTLQISGSIGSGSFYSDSGCSSALTTTSNLTAFNVTAGSTTTTVYFKDKSAESLNFNIVDPSSSYAMSAVTSTQPYTSYASKLAWTTSSTNTTSGSCAGPFTVQIQDANGTAVNAPAAGRALKMNGLTANATLHGVNNCSDSAITTITIPAGSASAQLYVQDTTNETLSLSVSDIVGWPATPSNLMMTATANVSLAVWPSQLVVTAPSPSPVPYSAQTSQCVGPVTVTLQNSLGAAATPFATITASLGGASSGSVGSGGGFYQDSQCANTLTNSQLTFTSSQSAQQFYYLSYYPGSPTLTAAAALPVNSSTVTPASAQNLTQGSLSLSIIAYPGWIGSQAGYPYSLTAADPSSSDPTQRYYTWQKGVVPARGRVDFPAGVERLHFNTSTTTGGMAPYGYLFATEYAQGTVNQSAYAQRVHMWDYKNSRYVGWMGLPYYPTPLGVTNPAGFPITGSFFPQNNSACVGNANQALMPGWCQGGYAWGQASVTNGRVNRPESMVDDGNYLYIYDVGNGAIMRFLMDSSSTGTDASLMNKSTLLPGAFAGWIGLISTGAGNAPTQCINSGGAVVSGAPYYGVGSPLQTPGWCVGGGETSGMYQANDNGGGTYQALAYDNSSGTPYLYVSSAGAVLKYNATTGAFVGWIGKTTTSTQSLWGTTGVPNCVNTPGGMCYSTAIFINSTNNTLTEVDGYYANVNTFNLTTGAYIGQQTFQGATGTLWNNWYPNGGSQIATDGTNYWIALQNRILQLNLATATLGQGIGRTSKNNVNATFGAMTSYLNAFDESSFMWVGALENDGNGSLIAAEGTNYGSAFPYPTIKKFNATTGAYQGAMVVPDNSPKGWSTSYAMATREAMGDNGLAAPAGSYVDTVNSLLYVVDLNFSRVKQIDLKSGKTLGWIGQALSSFTNGVPCQNLGGTIFEGFTNGWCTQSYSFTQQQTVQTAFFPAQNNGALFFPQGVTSDGTYIYVTDNYNSGSDPNYSNRLMRYRISDGSFQGWSGGLSLFNNITMTDPSAGQSGSTSCTTISGTSATHRDTPGWCMGGYPSCGGTSNWASCASGSGDATLNNPSSIYYYSGYLYVLDAGNHRIAKFNSSTGQFSGWIGKFAGAVGSCAYNTIGSGKYTNGWCLNEGVASSTSSGTYTGGTTDPGGGFFFQSLGYNNYSASVFEGITGDGTYLYISNSWNNRIDKYKISTGTYVGSMQIGISILAGSTTGWQATPTYTTQYNWDYVPEAVWTDGTSLYYTQLSNLAGSNTTAVTNRTTQLFKVNLSTGQAIGWKGGTTGSPGVVTPGNPNSWLTGGTGIATQGYSLIGTTSTLENGGFTYQLWGLSGDANYVYVSDAMQNRIIRVPK